MLILLAMTFTVGIPSAASAASDVRQSPASGGTEYGSDVTEGDEDDAPQTPTVPGSVAKIVGGVAHAPENAPDAVKQVIWAANEIVGLPYVYGGGHGDFKDDGYDCSGTVSYALHGADLLSRPRDSSSFFTYGARGRGSWITIYTELRPRVHDRRRHPARHERGRRPRRSQGSPLAPAAQVGQRLQGPPPRRPVARAASSLSPEDTPLAALPGALG